MIPELKLCLSCAEPEGDNLDCERCCLINTVELYQATLGVVDFAIKNGDSNYARKVIRETADRVGQDNDEPTAREILHQLGYFDVSTHFYSLNLTDEQLTKMQMAARAYPKKSDEQILVDALDHLVSTEVAHLN